MKFDTSLRFVEEHICPYCGGTIIKTQEEKVIEQLEFELLIETLDYGKSYWGKYVRLTEYQAEFVSGFCYAFTRLKRLDVIRLIRDTLKAGGTVEFMVEPKATKEAGVHSYIEE